MTKVFRCVWLFVQICFSYGASPANLPYEITLLNATRHGWTCPHLSPSQETSTRFTYPGGM